MSALSERYIYADNAATTPLSPAALEAMMPYLTSEFGNPGGIHRVAKAAANALADARARTAAQLGAKPHELYYTSGEASRTTGSCGARSSATATCTGRTRRSA